MTEKYQLPEGLLSAICEQETHWRNVVGAHGEIGVCQVQANTVKMICPECGDWGKPTHFTYGSRGDPVRRIQSVLAKEKLYLGPVDGFLGQPTFLAVVKYQKANGLAADGVVGPKTWVSMFGPPPYGASIAAALWDPESNIEWAARYLVWLRDNVSDDPVIMAAGYNGGPANQVVRYIRSVNAKRAALL
jgi:hypothetical protein